MSDELPSYYTFRPLDKHGSRFEASKWYEGSVRPSTRYIIETANGHCNCPASKRECKHVKCVEQIVALGVHFEMFRWKWDERNEWTRLSDIPTVEEMIA